MTKPIPKWIQTRYAFIWNKFKNKSFNYEQVCNILKDDKETISVFLSELRKAGWLEVTLNPEDARKRVYKLKTLEKALKEMVSKNSS